MVSTQMVLTIWFLTIWIANFWLNKTQENQFQARNTLSLVNKIQMSFIVDSSNSESELVEILIDGAELHYIQ